MPRPSLLQSPLQPLQDNLESQTYETFERDGTKYSTYEEAVYRCLLDRVPQVPYRMLLYCHWRSHTTIQLRRLVVPATLCCCCGRSLVPGGSAVLLARCWPTVDL